jgi:hypothetical protein
MPSKLESRLAPCFSAEPAERVMNGRGRWPGGFGEVMNQVRSVIVHLTAGWPPLEKADEFVKQYIGPPANPRQRKKAGIGPQYFIPGDGTVLRLINMPRVTWHGNDPFNNWAVGVETGNLGDEVAPQNPIPTNPKQDHRWRALGPDPAAPDPDLNASDIPGVKLWISLYPFREAIVSWWTTNTYAGPAREAVGNNRQMLFTEWQYRSWALLARYLCEFHDLPRNFPLLPHALRADVIDDSSTFRRIALADERFPVLLRALKAHNIEEEHFETANAKALQKRYHDAILPRDPPLARRNPVWSALFDTYRGVHGHGFSGATRMKKKSTGEWVDADHDCPGPLFDWHRFAREVWDWWWYPFDLSDDLSTAVVTPRPERHANGDTRLVEYYFEGRDFEAKDRAYTFLTLNSLRTSNGIFDDISSPSVFQLEPGVPIYAPANGELVAARFPDPRHAVSLAFVLVRHEIFHLPNTLTIDIEGVGSVLANPGRIDYDREPSYVYSLVMHLEQPEGMSFNEVTDANPEWLNRVLIRKKECDLALAFYDRPNHGGVAQAAWDFQPPGSVQRPTVLEGLRTDQAVLRGFLNTLSSGDVATWPGWMPGTMPIRVILGDFLGKSGGIRREGNTILHGIGLEVFSSGFVPPAPAFATFTSPSGFDLPAGAPLRPPPAIFYQSEWAKTPTTAERQRLVDIGVNPDLVPWWRMAALSTNLDPRLPAGARLVADGWAFHFRPLDFLRWINNVTWASEWPKYAVTDENGAEVPRPARPRPRRV